MALAVVAKHVETYHGGSVQVEEAPGKGRVLVAARDYDPGERILLEFPLVEVTVDESAPAFKLLKRLHTAGILEIQPLFYWAALCSLTGPQAAGAHVQSWPLVGQQTQEHIMELHAPAAACEVPSAGTVALAAELWPPGSGPDLHRLERILQSWIYNSFDLGDPEDGAEAAVMYLAASMVSHSCSPNAAWHLDDANSFILHARSEIGEGEEITIPYLGPADLCLPSCDRREILEVTKAFRCACERCVAPRDASRVFRCPRCSGSVLAVGEDEAGNTSSLACDSCGDLAEAEAAPLLEAESRLRRWARQRPEFYMPVTKSDEDELEVALVAGPMQKKPKVVAESEDASVALPSSLSSVTGRQRLQLAEAEGLLDGHWAVDSALAAAVDETTDAAEKCALLRRRITALEASGPHTVTRCSRLRLDLGRELSRIGGREDLKEAASAFGLAADSMGLLFGDDHREYQEADSLRDGAELAVRKASGSRTSTMQVRKGGQQQRGSRKRAQQ